jgi:hypothetical protein
MIKQEHGVILCHLLWPSWRKQKKCGEHWWKSEFKCQSQGRRYIKHQWTHCTNRYFLFFLIISVERLFFSNSGRSPRLLNPLNYHRHQFSKASSILFNSYCNYGNVGHHYTFAVDVHSAADSDPENALAETIVLQLLGDICAPSWRLAETKSKEFSMHENTFISTFLIFYI